MNGFQNIIKRVALSGIIALLAMLSSCKSSVPNIDSERNYLFRTKTEKATYYQLYDKTLSLFEDMPLQKQIPTRFGKTQVLIQGNPKNPALILLHGMDASSTMWYPNMTYWSKTHYVIAVDYIMDCGKSQLATKPLSKNDMVLFYSDVLNELKISKTSILGTSRGGWMATWLALHLEDKVEKLILLSPAQVFGMVKPSIAPAAVFKLFPSKSHLRATFKTFAYYPDKIAPEFQQQFLYASQHGRSLPQIFKMMPFSGKKLKQLNLPVLLLTGDSDVMNGKRAVRKARKLLPQAYIYVLDSCGHFMSTDQVSKSNQIVRDFLMKPMDSLQHASHP